jgi:hypothetical protein
VPFTTPTPKAYRSGGVGIGAFSAQEPPWAWILEMLAERTAAVNNETINVLFVFIIISSFVCRLFHCLLVLWFDGFG